MVPEILRPDGEKIVLEDGALEPYRTRLEGAVDEPTRLVYAAAHIALKPSYHDVDLGQPHQPEETVAHIDWETTLEVRRFLDQQGFGIAEAMDTAQRFQLGWAGASRLIEACGALGPANGFIAGAGTDHRPRVDSAREVIDAVLEQVEVIQAAGGQAIILPILWLARNGSESDYLDVYGEIIREADGPLFLHWLGPQFLPALEGYFPGDTFSRIVALDPEKVRGVKLSLLDDALELRLRRELLERDQIVLTGDDFHFGRLILGGELDGHRTVAPVERWTEIEGRPVALGDFSHGLLGIFDGIAEPAGVALRFLARGDAEGYLELMEPCEALGQWIFRAPTHLYKGGLAFLSWLNGRQGNPWLLERDDRQRSREHYLRTVELAVRARAISDATTAAERLTEFLAGTE